MQKASKQEVLRSLTWAAPAPMTFWCATPTIVFWHICTPHIRKPTFEWCEKQPEQLIRNGGTGRIRVFGIDEFDHADVTLDQNANIKCDMVKIVPLSKVGGETNEDDATPPNRQPVDPRIWYETQGRSVLEALISDLNSRGHSKLTLREDGDICIEQDEDAVSQEHLNNFPQKVYWPRLAEVLESNGLAAEVTAQGIQVSW